MADKIISSAFSKQLHRAVFEKFELLSLPGESDSITFILAIKVDSNLFLQFSFDHTPSPGTRRQPQSRCRIRGAATRRRLGLVSRPTGLGHRWICNKRRRYLRPARLKAVRPHAETGRRVESACGLSE